VTIVIFWLGFSIIVAVAAERRYQRNGFGWCVLSLAISPLLAGCLLLAIGQKKITKTKPPSRDWRNIDWSETKDTALFKEMAKRQKQDQKQRKQTELTIYCIIAGVLLLVFIGLMAHAHA